MAVAEELLIKVKHDTAAAERGITGMANKAETDAKRIGKAFENAGKKLTTRLTLPLLAAGGAAIAAFTKQEDATRKLQSAFESTGAAAWTSQEALMANADALQQITTHGDEAIEEMQSVLLTFTNVKGDVFDDATLGILNMSDALGMDLQSSAVMVGKALNDPVAGISAMSRAGITFSEEQKEMIKTMVEVGDTVGAQAIILGELETQFGGTAEAMAETSSGQMKQAMNTLGDSMEEVGAIIVPILVNITDFIGKLATKFSDLSGPVKNAIVIVAGIAAALGPLLIITGKVIQGAKALAPVIKGVGVAIKWVQASALGPWMIAIAALIAIGVLVWKNWDTIKEKLQAIWEWIKKAFDKFLTFIKDLWNKVWGGIKDFFELIWDGIKAFVKLHIDAISAIISGVINGIKDTWNTVWGAIQTTAETVWGAITGAVTGAIDTVQTTISDAIDTVQGWWTGFTDTLSDAWNGVWDTLGDGIEIAFNAVASIIAGVLNTILAGVESAINIAVDALNGAIRGANIINPFKDIPYVGKADLGRVSFADGGVQLNSGAALVGERGPEVVYLPKGASVEPHDSGNNANMPTINIERLEGGDPIALAEDIGWEFTKRGAA